MLSYAENTCGGCAGYSEITERTCVFEGPDDLGMVKPGELGPGVEPFEYREAVELVEKRRLVRGPWGKGGRPRKDDIRDRVTPA